MNARALRSRPRLPLGSAFVLTLAGLAPAQFVTYTARAGGNLAVSGPLGGPVLNHSFTTFAPVSDPLAVSEPGGPTWGASAASAQFDVVATATGISLAVSGTAMRNAPQAAVWATADGRDNWQFTIGAPMRFTFAVSLQAASSEPTVPPQYFLFAGPIVPDAGSPAAPYGQTLTAPGTVSINASGILMPGIYVISLLGRADGTTWPYAGSYSHSMVLTMQPVATAPARAATGNPNSYTCGVPLLGQTWQAAVDLTLTGHAFAVVWASFAPAQTPLGPGLTLLIAPPLVEFLPIQGGPVANYALAIPANPTLAGFQLFTQALHFGGPPTFALSNARDLTLGF